MKEQVNIITISNSLFEGTKPINNEALNALNDTIKNIRKDKPTLNNRL